MRVLIKTVADNDNWEDRWDQSFETAADARAFIDMVLEFGIDDLHAQDMMDLNVVFDLNEEAFVIYAEE